MKRLVLVALSVLGLSVAAQPIAVHAQKAASGKTMTASGPVKAVSGTSLTVTSGGKDMTFTIDGSTKFVGKGLSTKSAAGKLTATDAVGMGDRVTVSYHDMGGTMHAANVRITSKSITKK
jgi:hypothetical protein